MELGKERWGDCFHVRLQFYWQMLKNHRSMSQILQSNAPTETLYTTPTKALFLQSTQLQRHYSEFQGPKPSKLQFGQAKTANKETGFSRRNKSLSCSKLKLFEKAHQVSKEESYQKQQSSITNKQCSFSVSSQLAQHRLSKKEGKMQEIIEKRLIIDKVIQSTQEDGNNATRLTIRSQLEQRRMAKTAANSSIEAFTMHQAMAASKMPSDLVYSKDFQLQNESRLKVQGCRRCENGSGLWQEEAMRNYSRQLTANMQESLKKQLQGHYQIKEKELEQRYMEKQQKYLQKLKDLEVIMEVKLQRERTLLIQNINSQLQKQFDKVKAERKEEEAKQQTIQKQQNQSLVQKIPEKIVQSNKNVTNGSQKGNRSIVEEVIQEQPRVIQRKAQKSVASIVAEPPKPKPLDPPPPVLKQQKKKPAVVFRDVDNDLMDEIDEVQLDYQPTKSKVKTGTKPSTNLAKPSEPSNVDRVNMSFNVDSKLDNSFSSERPVNKKGKETSQLKQTSPQEKRQLQLEKLRSEEEERRSAQQQVKRKAQYQQSKTKALQQVKAKKAQQQAKSKLRVKLKQYAANDPIMVSIGEVAGFCSKFCKKSEVDWRMASLLLYRYCLDLFRSYRGTFQQAERLKLVKKEELESYRNYDSVMQANLAKMYRSFQKKMTIPEPYRQLVESTAVQLDQLRPYALMEARKYVEQLRKSPQGSVQSGDVEVVQCGLRVINSALAIRKIAGETVELLPLAIGDLSREESFALFAQWSPKVTQEK